MIKHLKRPTEKRIENFLIDNLAYIFADKKGKEIKSLSLSDIVKIVAIFCESYFGEQDETIDKKLKGKYDVGYLIGILSTQGSDALQKELTRLKEMDKQPHEILF